MVLLRKWGNGEGPGTLGDYPIFMAIADAVGHNKRGNTIHKRNPDGSLVLAETVIRKMKRTQGGQVEEVLVRSKQPIVDDELDDVANSYLEWLEKMSAVRLGKRGGA